MIDQSSRAALDKAATGIQGLDEVTSGGLPKGRTTLVAGSAGVGKTMLAMQFLINGALQYDEPGVFVAFEETPGDLTANFASLGYDIDALCQAKKLALDYIHIERSEIEETGEYDLEGLFIRLNHAVNSVGAKRVVLDTIEVLFSGLNDSTILRAELRRLFRWLKDRNLTAIVTGERGDNTITRFGLEEYVADCVILLDHRVTEQISTRRLRVVKYRGSSHGSNEYPFLITEGGLAVMPITSAGLTHEASHERVSTGVKQIDDMLGGEGFYRGSSILVSGTAGTGKSALAASFVAAGCKRGERCLYFSFEESPSQILRNMLSLGLDLEPYIEQNLLLIHAVRPTGLGLETHLADMMRIIGEWAPRLVVVDPVSDLVAVADTPSVKTMLTRLVDYLKMRDITTLFTHLAAQNHMPELAGAGVSSVMDAWVVLRDVETEGDRRRELHILKSRGMSHSARIVPYQLTDDGIRLADMAGSGGTDE